MNKLEEVITTTIEKLRDELLEKAYRDLLIQAIDEANRNIEPYPPNPRFHIAEDKTSVTIFIGTFEYYVATGDNKLMLLDNTITMILGDSFRRIREKAKS